MGGAGGGTDTAPRRPVPRSKDEAGPGAGPGAATPLATVDCASPGRAAHERGAPDEPMSGRGCTVAPVQPAVAEPAAVATHVRDPDDRSMNGADDAGRRLRRLPPRARATQTRTTTPGHAT